MRRLTAPIVAGLISTVLAIGLLTTSAYPTPVATSNPAPVQPGKTVTITATLGPANTSYIVIPTGFTVTSWSPNCRVGYQSTRPAVSDEVCSGTFSFTAIAPAAPTAPQSYPLLAGYWYGVSRNRPSYARPVAYLYLDTLYG